MVDPGLLACDTYRQLFFVHQDMAVRGAPAIAIAAALALAAELVNQGGGAQFESAQAAYQKITEQLEYLVTRCVQVSPVSLLLLSSDSLSGWQQMVAGR